MWKWAIILCCFPFLKSSLQTCSLIRNMFAAHVILIFIDLVMVWLNQWILSKFFITFFRTLYATAIRLLCQTWEMNDRAFGSLQVRFFFLVSLVFHFLDSLFRKKKRHPTWPFALIFSQFLLLIYPRLMDCALLVFREHCFQKGLLSSSQREKYASVLLLPLRMFAEKTLTGAWTLSCLFRYEFI